VDARAKNLVPSASRSPLQQSRSCTCWPSVAIAEKIGSRALRADAMESITCGWLSFVVVAGLLAQLALGAWWIDSITSLAIVYFLIKEGREAWAVEECGCSCGH
jgi:hypothetical protein